jgi:hypothetical protein
MRHLFLLLIFSMITFQGFSQKANVKIIKTLQAGSSEWQILDDKYRLVFSDSYYHREDTIFLTLESDTRYFLQISVNEITNTDTILYSLRVQGEEIITVSSGIDPGDHFLPFYTGVKQDPSKIIGGTDADIADFPWQVYIRAGNYMCGGTIIAPDWILTAAHCTKNEDGSAIPASEIRIRAGATNPYIGQGAQYLVSQVIVHESYNRQTLQNDLALLKLQTPVNVPNATPIRLLTPADASEGATDPGVMTWVTGWGLTKVNPEVSPVILQKVQMPIVSNQTASSVWSSIPAYVIMAGYRDGNKETCNGDSGGPMVVPVSGEYKIAGIVSWGNNTCSTYSGFTQVSAFESWIRTKTGIYEYAPPVPEGNTLVCEGTLTGTYYVAPVAGATSYEWVLFPGDAGTISGTSEISSVAWNSKYTGKVTVKLRVLVAGKMSEWSRLNVTLAKTTKIISQSAGKVLCQGESFTLGVDAVGDNLKYVWYKDGEQTVYQTPQIQITNASPARSGNYIVVISGSCGVATSAAINVVVHPETKITYVTPDTTAMFGDDVSLRVLARGHNLQYLWEKNGKPLPLTGYSQTFENANSNDIGIYRVRVTGTCGSVLTNKFYLYINGDNNQGVSLWPTLTSTDFKVALSTDAVYHIRVFSSTGKLMKEIRDCRYQTTVNISHFAKGLYIVKVYSKSLSVTRRVIKD